MVASLKLASSENALSPCSLREAESFPSQLAMADNKWPCGMRGIDSIVSVQV